MIDPIQWHTIDDIGILTVNRPAARNALNWAAQTAFAERIATLAADNSYRALIITGSGNKAFVAGGDLNELAATDAAVAGPKLRDTMTHALAQLTQLPVPVIAAVNGDAIGGGCEILTACDLRIGAPHARLRFGQIKVGLSTGWGGGLRLVQQLGLSRALDLLLTGRLLSADEALTIGLLHRVSPPDTSVLDAAVSWAQQLVQLPHDAMAALKQVAWTAAQADAAALQTAQQVEQDAFLALYGSANHREALAAFQARRQPTFNRESAT